ncbi:hypothetical protein ACI3L1_09330 [Deinococcus sp. SM5_A1]|uniref:hypothetical protein n=1 Tax=Deinococcus sp. SM5_A1 TaxID=3379094 RepID=UPI00385EF092
MTATPATYICLTCNNENPANYRYCRGCRSQARCFECDELLEPRAEMCFACGTATRPLAASPNSSPNAYSLREHSRVSPDGTQEHSLEIDLRIATEGLEHVGALYGIAGAAGRRQPTVTAVSRTLPVNAPALAEFAEETATLEDAQGQLTHQPEALPAPVISTPQENDLLASVRPHFHHADDDVVCSLSNFRGKTQKENTQRFIVLYTLAHQDATGQKIDQEKVRRALEKKGMFDKNYNAYLKHVHQKYFVEAGGKHVLTEDGHQYLKEILQALALPLDEADETPRLKRTAKSGKIRYSKEHQSIVDQMIDASQGLPNFSPPENWAPRHYGALALWLMSRVLDGPQAISSRMASEYLEKLMHGRSHYGAAAHSEGFGRRSKGFFRQNSHDLYTLTNEGNHFVEQWLAENHPLILERAQAASTQGTV